MTFRCHFGGGEDKTFNLSRNEKSGLINTITRCIPVYKNCTDK